MLFGVHTCVIAFCVSLSKRLGNSCARLQVMVTEMLSAWGDAGLAAHVADMQRSYARRAGVILAAAEKRLPGLASWLAPQVMLLVTGALFQPEM